MKNTILIATVTPNDDITAPELDIEITVTTTIDDALIELTERGFNIIDYNIESYDHYDDHQQHIDTLTEVLNDTANHARDLNDLIHTVANHLARIHSHAYITNDTWTADYTLDLIDLIQSHAPNTDDGELPF